MFFINPTPFIKEEVSPESENFLIVRSLKNKEG